jgi:xanthine dehydrogenase accessory factor
MKELQLWKFILGCISAGEAVALLVVIDSEGSSPGRKGFKMAASSSEMIGSIGGGIMEHKLVEYVRDRLEKKLDLWEAKRQIHSKEAPENQSGMICSGAQTIALLKIDRTQQAPVESLILRLEAGEKVKLDIDSNGLTFSTFSNDKAQAESESLPNTFWHYQETLGARDIAHVIGAGHVGLEMCKALATLDFFVVNYDDRPDLNTMAANQWAHRKIITPYSEIRQYVPDGENVYVIVMTFGYRGDDEAIRALLGCKFKYLGMMGSEAKVLKLLSDLRRDGFLESDIQRIRTPAGLVPHCKTPAEIAVSIAAEIIATKNSLA